MYKSALVEHPVVYPKRTTNIPQAWPKHCNITSDNTCQDHFIKRDNTIFAGSHLILDFWGAKYLDDLNHIEQALRYSVEKANATLLHIHLHYFTPNGGVSGVAVLAESHISVHTWPERDFAAFDIFMCGDSKPEEALIVLKNAFYPKQMKITEQLRGVVENG